MTQNKLNRGELVCLIPSGSYPYTEPIIGLVMRDWCEWTHGDHIEIKWLNAWGCTQSEPHYIQTFDEFGQYGF